jgi:hypothetical protein
MEPFLTVRGRLQKDGSTLNVIATRVEPLRAGVAPPPEGEKAPPRDPFRYLTALRQSPPDVKSFS